MNASHRFSRRTLIQGMGLSPALLPLLERPAGAANAAPKRVIIVVQTNGTLADRFFPKGDLAAGALPEITAPLEPYKSDLIFMENLELESFTENPVGGAHENFAILFNGARGEPNGACHDNLATVSQTIDQYIADGVQKQIKLPFNCLSLGVQVDRSGSHVCQRRCFYRGAGQPVTPDEDPMRVADRLFASSAMPTAQLDQMRAERRSILDYVGRDLTNFGKNLGSPDRQKIEAHLTSLRNIEQQLGGLAGATCAKPTVGSLALDDGTNYPKIMDVQMDLLVAALRCDLTRVATVQLTNANGANLVFSWLGIQGDGQEFPIRDSHDIAHRPGDGGKDKARVENWYMQQFAGLIKRLKDTKEEGGTMLDNTAVLWVNHMGNGGAHSSSDLPWVIAGKCGGYFKTGQYLRSSKSVSVNGVLIALANAMGVTTTTFGDGKYGTELVGLKA